MSIQSETITFIPIKKLIPFRDHPFQIRDDEQMKMITESIRSVGVLVPAIATPSLSQAQRMKQLSREGKLTDDIVLKIMTEQKKPECWNLTIPMNKVSKYFPKSYTPQ